MSKIEERVKNSHKNSEYYKDQGSDIFYAEVNGEYTESQVSLLEYYFFDKIEFPKSRSSKHEARMEEVVQSFSISIDQVTLDEIEGVGWIYKVEGIIQVSDYEEKLLELLNEEFPDTIEYWRYEYEYMDSLPDMEGYPPSKQGIKVIEIHEVEIFEEIELVEVEYTFYLKKIEDRFYIYYNFPKHNQYNMDVEGLSVHGEEFYRENNKTFRKIHPWAQYFIASESLGWTPCREDVEECNDVWNTYK